MQPGKRSEALTQAAAWKDLEDGMLWERTRHKRTLDVYLESRVGRRPRRGDLGPRQECPQLQEDGLGS